MAASSTLGAVVDFFGLEESTGGALIAEWSDDGIDRSIVVEHNGNDGDDENGEPPPFAQSYRLRSPAVRYRVVARKTISVIIGKGFSGSFHGLSTGYMISSVSVETRIGEAPSITVSGVANEGADAARKYTFSFTIAPRHRPQDALAAFSSGGGDLLELTFGFSCDPVVIYDGSTPIASDITHGRIFASATFADYDGTANPVASAGFVNPGVVITEPGDDYRHRRLEAFREVF